MPSVADLIEYYISRGSNLESVSDSPYYLGLNYIGHDASASLVKNGQLVASAPEERFSRQKKDRSFPENAIEFCLSYEGIELGDIDAITYYMDPEAHFRGRVVDHLGKYYPESVPLFDSMLERAQKVNNVEDEIRSRLGFRGEIYFCTHHLAHIASSYYPSGFDSAAAISMDGLGEIASTVVAEVDEDGISVLKEIEFPHSLGMLYNAVTHYLGFNGTTDAGKVMGLSSYGDPSRYIDDFRDIVRFTDNGGYEFDLEYFAYPFERSTWVSERFVDRFGPMREEGATITQRHEDVAAALQKRVEEAYFHLAEWVQQETGQDTLCLAGGVALNSVANGRLVKSGLFEDVYIPPTAGDDGTSVGGALYYHHCVEENQNRGTLSPYMGPEYSDDEVQDALDKLNLNYHHSDDVFAETAEYVANGNIVGWFQGRMEMGPRALGNRSIIGDPRDPSVKDVINSSVKFREPFRPFAPSILEDAVDEWFDHDDPSPYMILVYDVLQENREEIPGVTHVDGTGRLQTVSETDNRRYYRLIEEFEKRTGVPIVVNTSFNIKGEPIVNTPMDAIRCFLGSGLDYLVMNEYVLDKQDL